MRIFLSMKNILYSESDTSREPDIIEGFLIFKDGVTTLCSI